MLRTEEAFYCTVYLEKKTKKKKRKKKKRKKKEKKGETEKKALKTSLISTDCMETCHLYYWLEDQKKWGEGYPL